MSRKDTRNGSLYAKRSKRFRIICESNDAPCALCHGRIDYSLRFPDRMSFTVDHITPTHLGGDPYDLNNMQPAHFSCNARRGDGTRRRNGGEMPQTPRCDRPLGRIGKWREGGIPSP